MNNNMAEFDDEFLKILEKTIIEHDIFKKFVIKNGTILFLIVVILPIMAIIGSFSSKVPFLLSLGLIMPFVIFGGWIFLGRIYLKYEDYEKFYKENFVFSVIKRIDKNFSFSHRKTDNTNSILYSDIGIPRYDRMVREDFIGGTYKGIEFEFAEYFDIDTSNISSTVFLMPDKIKILKYFFNKKERGFIFICNFYKDFKFDLKIINRKVSQFGINFDKLDNVEFNKFFKVTGGNKTETRYLLSPNFMERLCRLNLGYKFGFISAAFINDKFCLFAENCKDLFEVMLLKKPSLELARYYKKEFLEILSVIDELNLTLNIYPKTVLKNQKLTR